MQHGTLGRLGWLAILLATLAMGGASATPPADRAVSAERLKPQWQVGDQWVVETTTLQSQVADAEQAKSRTKPIQWRFTVQAVEPLAGRPCYRLRIQVVAGPRHQPVTLLWVDQKTMTLRQVQTQLHTPRGLKTLTESYQTAGNAAAPVLGPLVILPLDLPAFVAGGVKGNGADTFSYESLAGPSGTKTVGDVGFSYAVRQECFAPQPEHVKGLLNDAALAGPQAAQPVEVRLKTVDRSVRQLWQTGQPWPSYADNGVTEARLVRVIPTSGWNSETREVQP